MVPVPFKRPTMEDLSIEEERAIALALDVHLTIENIINNVTEDITVTRIRHEDVVDYRKVRFGPFRQPKRIISPSKDIRQWMAKRSKK